MAYFYFCCAKRVSIVPIYLYCTCTVVIYVVDHRFGLHSILDVVDILGRLLVHC